MKGWLIFKHSALLVLRNLDAAFRVSAVLYFVQVIGQVYSHLNPPQMVDMGGFEMVDPAFALQGFLFGVIAIVASLWIAVAWHRYVLAEEMPQGWLPRWHGSYMLSYLGRSLMIGILIMIAGVVAMIPVGLVGSLVPGLAGVLVFALVGLAAYLFFRLGVILPAAAIGQPFPVGQAWAATKTGDGAIEVLAIIVILGSFLVQLPSLVGGGGTLIDLIYHIVTGWFVTIIGISVLTTLYGHYVEGRSID